LKEIDFEKLESAVTHPRHRPSEQTRPALALVLAEKPAPFVAPPLRFSDIPKGGAFAAEVVFVNASAAVGKTTMARYLSASQRVPLLDLSKVPVSTGSLKSLVSDLSGEGDPVKSFHAGELPIIIDALDEGRLLSSETGFEYFLRTTGEFLLQDRSVITHPKLIIFGRHDSIGDATAWLEISGEGISTCSVEVGFFAEKDARDLIDAYASAGASPDSAYRRHPEPARELVDAYFIAIETALGLPRGQLWTDEQGRAFAGYAPVLAALGSLLARMDNFNVVANRLKSEGRQEAWSVIETVLGEILKRERKRLCDKLALQIEVPVPEEAYDAHEQLTFLARRVHDKPLGASTRVSLPAMEQVKYHTMVAQDIGDHPFVRQGKPSNAVLGSLVLAHAVSQDLLAGTDTRLLADLSRQPFLWRSLRSQIKDSPNLLVDGRYLGYVLNSYWNDPIIRSPRVAIRSVEDGAADVHMPTEGGQVLLLIKVALPLHFYGQLRDCDADVQGAIKLEGHAAIGSASAFYVYGKTTIIGETIDVAADTLTIDGQFWLECAVITSSPRLNLNPKKNAEVGWGGNIASRYPWNGLPTTLAPPYVVKPGDVLTALINECALRLPDRVLVTNDDYSFSESENQWIARNFRIAFPELLKLLIKHNLARAEGFGTYAQKKFRIHMNTKWLDLRDAFGNRSSDPKLRAFVEDARRIFAAQ
jgi:hypothetical protein